MDYEEFKRFVEQNCMYETIYNDSENREVLVIRLIDAFGMVKDAIKETLEQPAQEPVAYCKHGVPKGVCRLGERDCNPAPSWQLLSLDEIIELQDNFGLKARCIFAIEDMLKEKNHGQ